MKSIVFVAAAALALPPLSFALAQNQLPPTTITAPKPKPKPPLARRAAPSHGIATDTASTLPDLPDPETPKVRARDWNAPGVMNLNYMTETQFVAFQAAHPTAVFYGRCFAGQDPDPNIRAFFRRRVPFGCGG